MGLWETIQRQEAAKRKPAKVAARPVAVVPERAMAAQQALLDEKPILSAAQAKTFRGGKPFLLQLDIGMEARVEKSRIARGLKSRAETIRALIAEALK